MLLYDVAVGWMPEPLGRQNPSGLLCRSCFKSHTSYPLVFPVPFPIRVLLFDIPLSKPSNAYHGQTAGRQRNETPTN